MIRPIAKLLIANRGEIALRIARTCRQLGIESVAVFSDADADAPHVRGADSAIHIGSAASGGGYLAIERIVDAARDSGADAIHPGYGFLAENGDFAAACAGAGITFVGPPAQVIATLGSKLAAKAIAQRAGAPTIPGFDLAAPERMEFPVLLKASAGGGGKGMHIVRERTELAAAIDSATRIARSAFGDDALMVERYIERPRHVELQVMADAHSNVIHLGERECSIQRRHQKIVEESPSPAVDDELRARMGAAAVAIAKEAGYVNAGTVEFILDREGNFYFLEVNTRLQVEHAVTELRLGIDLVREQIRIAEGHRLAWAQSELTPRGCAIELRLYAEDPRRQFLPQAGTVLDWHVPSLPGLRVDAGIEVGTAIGADYDPMLVKIIAHADSRPDAIRRLRYGLSQLCCAGVGTNQALLLAILDHEAFVAGDTHTHFLTDHAQLCAASAPASAWTDAALAATLAGFAARRAARMLLPALEPGFRNNPFCDQRVDFDSEVGPIGVTYRNLGGNRLAMTIAVGDGEPEAVDACLASFAPPVLAFECAGARRTARVVSDGLRWFVHVAGHTCVLDERPRFGNRDVTEQARGCVAPTPGRVVSVLAAVGDNVVAHQPVVILEAMKMEHKVAAGTTGTVTAVLIGEGDQVAADQGLVVIEATDDHEL